MAATVPAQQTEVAANTTALRARMFHVFGDATRLAILELLLDGEKSVSELVAAIGAPQSRVSNHLACLRWCGLVSVRREGNYIYYRIADPRVEAMLELAGEQATDFAEALASCGRLGDEGVPSY